MDLDLLIHLQIAINREKKYIRAKQVLIMLRAPLLAVARRAALTSSWRRIPGASVKVMSTKIYAVDAPDGDHDYQDMAEHSLGVRTIVDFAALHENVNEINALHEAGKSRPFAVDAPDGEHDLEGMEEHASGVASIVDFAASHENPKEINAMHEAGKVRAFAVDAPDGEHDLEDLEEHAVGVSSIIGEAAVLEDAEAVKKHQLIQTQTRNIVASHGAT